MLVDVYARLGFTIVVSAALLVVPAGGCASEPKLRPAALDPSNPAAPESPPLAVAALSRDGDLPPAAPRATGDDHGGSAGKPQAIIYTCPMHPEVTSDKPGRCPKCGMNLVPKPPAEGKK